MPSIEDDEVIDGHQTGSQNRDVKELVLAKAKALLMGLEHNLGKQVFAQINHRLTQRRRILTIGR